MKRAVLSLGLIALLASVLPASAQLGGEEREEKYLQVPHRWQLFMDGGIGMPTDPGLFNDFWNTSFQFGVGGGFVIFPWLEVNGTFNNLTFSNNAIASMEKVGYTGTKAIEGGTIHTKMYWGSARFIAVPHARTNPFIEIGVGGFKTKADDLLKQLKGGADFAELAKKNSEDGSAEQGGDLGFFVRNQMVPEFDVVAFSLKPQELSGVVTSQFGYHIIQVTEKEPAKLKPFEDVKDELAKEVRAQSVADKMQSLGDEMHAALVKAPKSVAEVARKYNADAIVMPSAAAGEAIPTLGVNPEIDQTLASMKPEEVSPVLVLPNNRMAVVILNGRTPGRPAEFSEVQAQIRDKLTDEKAAQIANDRAKDAAERLKKGEDISKIAKSMQLEVTTSSSFGRADSIDGIGPAATLEDVFTAKVGQVLGPLMIQSRNIIAKVTEKSEADLTALPVERDGILGQLKQKKAQERNALLMDGILAKLTSEGKVVVHQKEIQSMSADLRKR